MMANCGKLILALAASCSFGAFAGTISYTSNTTVSAPLEMTEATTIDVAAGVTVTYDALAVVSGAFKLTKTGTGTLVLAAANTFSGGLAIANGTVRIDKEGAQGTGAISITTTSGATGLLFLHAANMTISNPISISSAYSDAKTAITMDVPVTVDSNITSSNGRVVVGAAGTDYSSVSNTWNGNLTAYSSVYVRWGVNVFNGAITANGGTTYGCLSTGDSASQTGLLVLGNPKNSFSGGINMVQYNGVTCEGVNVLGGGYLTQGRFSSNVIRLNGYDQKLSYLSNNSEHSDKDVWEAPPAWDSTRSRFESSSPATLTLTGGAAGGSATTYMSLRDNVSLCCDFKNPTFTQIFTNRYHTTDGSFEVKSGIVRIMGEGSHFRLVSSLSIGETGEVQIENGSTRKAFQVVTNVVVDGKLTVADTAAVPVTDGCAKMSIGASGLVKLPAGKVLDVDGLTIDGRPLPYGTYGGTDSAADDKKYASHFSGTGYILNRSKAVKRGFAVFFR